MTKSGPRSAPGSQQGAGGRGAAELGSGAAGAPAASGRGRAASSTEEDSDMAPCSPPALRLSPVCVTPCRSLLSTPRNPESHPGSWESKPLNWAHRHPRAGGTQHPGPAPSLRPLGVQRLGQPPCCQDPAPPHTWLPSCLQAALFLLCEPTRSYLKAAFVTASGTHAVSPPGRSLHWIPQPTVAPSSLQAAISAHVFTGPGKRDLKSGCFES